jgi:hypothetical protein
VRRECNTFLETGNVCKKTAGDPDQKKSHEGQRLVLEVMFKCVMGESV